MSKNIYGLTNLTNETVVEVIRRKFLLETDTNPHFYHPVDVERCRSEGWQVERFLLEKGTPEEALKSLIKAMQWKKSFGIHERSHTHFPRELPLIFFHEKPSRDREGRLCIWAASRLYKKISDFDALIKQYVALHYEFMDRKAGNKGFISVSDAKAISFSNVDMSMAKFSANVMEYYPQVLKLGITLDVPWLMMSMWKMLKSIMPKSATDKIALIKREEMSNHIDIDMDELPANYGGNRELIFDFINEMLPLNECKHLHFTDKQIDNFYKVYNFDII